MRCRSLWCGQCYEGAKGRRYSRGHLGYVKCTLRKERPQVVRRNSGPVRDGPGTQCEQIPLTAWSKEFRHVWDFICESRYDDGTDRLPGTVLLCVGEGRVRLWLHNRDEGLSAWLSGGSVEAVFEAANQALGTATVEWRRSKNNLSKNPD